MRSDIFVRGADENRAARLNFELVLCSAALGTVTRWQKRLHTRRRRRTILGVFECIVSIKATFLMRANLTICAVEMPQVPSLENVTPAGPL